VIVTALRIIEREESSDRDCLQRQKSTGFMPQGRPKRWKEKGLAVLRINVQERIEGNQLDTREDNKMWLVRHLELVRMITLEDLRIAKSLCQPVFPPSYKILDHFMHLYHEALSSEATIIVSFELFFYTFLIVKDLILDII
jgi:exocyst complex component 3